jgi:hypothetical protein
MANADLSFDMAPDLQPDADSAVLLSNTDKLLEQRRADLGMEQQPQKKALVKKRTSPRIARKLRFSKHVSEDMDTS